MFIRVVFFFLFALQAFFLQAQQSPLHFIPPIYTVITGYRTLEYYGLFLSTTKDSSFYVKLYEGISEVPFDSVLISSSSPKSYDLGSCGEAIGIVESLGSLNKPLNSDGLFLKADFPFFANTRGKSGIHGGSLTSKGLAALGKDFRTGHLVSYELPSYKKIDNTHSHFIAVMATENNTRVRFSDFRDGAVFHGLSVRSNREKSGGLPVMKDKVVLLQKGQSYIIAEIGPEFINGFENASFGLHITSNNPIAVNVGSIAGLPPTKLIPNFGKDIGFDQIVPVDRLGNEYAVIQGEGTLDFEKVVIVATRDKTKVVINDKKKVTLDAGDYFISDYFIHKVMHLKGSNPFYVYQNTAGSASDFTCGFNFLPSWNECIINTDVAIADFSYLNASKASSTINGVMLNVTSKVDTKVNILNPVSGEQYHSFEIKKAKTRRRSLPFNTVTYKLPADIDNILVTSADPVNLSLTYKDSYIGAASYFSGFITPPSVEVDKQSIVTFKEKGYLQLTSIVSEGYDSYEWYKDGAFFKKTTENRVDVSKPGKYKVVGIRGSCKIKGNYKLIDIDKIEEEILTSKVEEKIETSKAEALVIPINELIESVEEDSVFLDKLKTEISSDSISKKAILPNLNFEYNTAVLVSKSKELLKDVVALLKQYPKVTLKITAHTDCRGSDAYNQSLSEKRAHYVKEYMVNHGIDAQRLSSEGMGEKEPLNDCVCDQQHECSEEAYLANRRVEFVVMSK